MSQIHINAFCTLLTAFLNELVKTFPEIDDLKAIKTMVAIAIPFKPDYVVENYTEIAGRYHVKIFEEESSFFEDLENWKKDPYFQQEYLQSTSDTNDIFQKLGIFKNIWTDLSVNNKKMIWDFLQKLLVLCTKASNLMRDDIRKSIIEFAKKRREINSRG